MVPDGLGDDEEGATPRLSVVMPSLNSASFIGRAVESVLSQGVAEVEVLIQDGASTDSTLEILERLSDDRVSVVSEPDSGQSAAINKGLARAQGEWVLWLNADDEVAPGGLGRLLAATDDAHDMVYGGFGLIDARGTVFKAYESSALEFERIRRRGAYIFSGAMAVRRDILLDAGGVDETLHYCMDYELLLRLAQRVRARRVPGQVAYLRSHPEAKSRALPWRFLREQHAVLCRYGVSRSERTAILSGMALTIVTAPIRRSPLWLRLRPRKTL